MPERKEPLLGGRSRMPMASRRALLAAVAALAALAALAAVASVGGQSASAALLQLDAKQQGVAAEALAWFKKEHPHTAALIGDKELAREAASTTRAVVVPHRPETLLHHSAAAAGRAAPGAAAADALPAGWYKGVVALDSAEWDSRLRGSILKANAMTLAKAAGHLQTLAATAGMNAVRAEVAGLQEPAHVASALEALKVLPMSQGAASTVKCDDREDCLHGDLFSRFLPAREQAAGCPAGSKCELHQVWLACGSKQDLCPVYLYARPAGAALASTRQQQLHSDQRTASVVLDEPKFPAYDAEKMPPAGSGQPAVLAGSTPSEYNTEAGLRGEFATGAHSSENTETYDHLKAREMAAGHKGRSAALHGPEGKWATRLPSDDNKKGRTWYPSRIAAEAGREEADGKQDAGTLRWKKKIAYAKGYPEQDGFHYLGGYQDSRTATPKAADSPSGKGLKGVNVYHNPLLDDDAQRHAWYKDTVRKADRSRGASATVPEAAKVVQGAAEFVYGKGNSKKGHLPGVQVDNDLLSGVPNPLGEIMKVVPAREQELAQVEGPARTQALSGLSSLLTRPRAKQGLTPQQREVLRDDSTQLLGDFFGHAASPKHAAAAPARGAARESAMAAAGERRSNEQGGLMSSAVEEGQEERGVESPEAVRARKMRANAAKLVRERADAREMREKGEARRARLEKSKSRRLALKLDRSLPVTEEGELLAKSEMQFVHRLEAQAHKPAGFEAAEQRQRAEERRMLGRRAAPRAGRASRVSADSAVRREESRLEQQAIANAAKEIGVPKRALSRRVRARMAAPRVRAADAELRQEERRLEKQAMARASKEIGVPKQDLARNVRSRLAARRQHVQASRSGGAGLNINMVGAHRKVGPQQPGTVAEGDLESLDHLLFGEPTSGAKGKARKARLPGVHLWGLSDSPDLKAAAKDAWKDSLKEMHLSHVHTQAGLRDGIWSGSEVSSTAMKAARLQQLALPSSVRDSAIWPSGHWADERVQKSALKSVGGADDYSASGLLGTTQDHSNWVNSDVKFARGRFSDDVRAPCDNNDSALCDAARAQPRVEIGAAPAALPAMQRKSIATQQLAQRDEWQLREARERGGAARRAATAPRAAGADQSVASMMLAAMGKDPQPYEERRLARKAARAGVESPGVLQMMKGVWAGEGNVGAEWHKCGHGDINCPPPEMGGYAAREPYNHISGEYHPPEFPADTPRAHYRKRLDGKADERDYYNDDVITPLRRNRLREPEHPDPDFEMPEYAPHEGYDAENETKVEAYPHLVRWDKEKWKEAGIADCVAGCQEGDDHDECVEECGAEPEEGDADDDENGPSDEDEDGPSDEDARQEEEEEEDETGLRPGTLTMRAGRHADNVTWEGIARRRLNDTLSAGPKCGENDEEWECAEEDGGWKWDKSPLDDRDDQHSADFLEYEPQHMHMKSLEGYYKLTPKKYMDFRGVHPWHNTEDREDHHGPLMTLERDEADFPNNRFNYDMDRNTEKGHLPGVNVDAWAGVDVDSQSRPSASNEFVASEPASDRIARRHHVIISDQEMNERVGTGGVMGRDQGGSTDDSWVAKHHAHRTVYPATADPGADLTGGQVWH